MADGAVTWNTWQKGLAALRARYMDKDPKAAGPGDVAYSTWSQRLWCELSEGVGPGMAEAAESGQEHPVATPKWRTSSGTEHQCACVEDGEDAAPDVQGWWSSSADELMEQRLTGAA